MNPNQEILDQIAVLRRRVDGIEATRGHITSEMDPNSERYLQRTSAKWLEGDYGLLPLPDRRGT